jgi:hypothetical protein
MAVLDGADYDANAEAIIEAVDSCPVNVIGIVKE